MPQFPWNCADEEWQTLSPASDWVGIVQRAGQTWIRDGELIARVRVAAPSVRRRATGGRENILDTPDPLNIYYSAPPVAVRPLYLITPVTVLGNCWLRDHAEQWPRTVEPGQPASRTIELSHIVRHFGYSQLKLLIIYIFRFLFSIRSLWQPELLVICKRRKGERHPGPTVVCRSDWTDYECICMNYLR